MQRPIFLLADIVKPYTPKEESEKRLAETIELIHTYTGHDDPVIQVVQQKTHPNPTTYLGTGKVAEVFEMMKHENIRHIILNDIVKPGQIHDLKMELHSANHQVVVWDRVDLILQIFAKHAATAEAKLQIELAAMRHMGPRIYGMGLVLSRQGGGVGGRGIGETNTELMKRHWRDEMRQTKMKIEKLQHERKNKLDRRRELGMKTIAIVGYTNAGKSTLFNTLTGKHKLAKDALFATLDSAVGKISSSFLTSHDHHLPSLLVSDTIGFMQRLPPELIDAFKSTLMETIHAHALIHLVDASDPDIEEKIHTVEKTLTDIGADQIPRLVVFNKIDKPSVLSPEHITRLQKTYHPIFISAQDSSDVKNLVTQLTSFIR